MNQIILITGASSGFGALAARALARAGHTVYASMRSVSGSNAQHAQAARAYAAEHGLDLRPLELDVLSQASADAAVRTVLAEQGRLDVVVHNAGHMVFGPAEAFTPEQYAELYDVNVLGTQRVNRAALPQLRKQGHGLLLWVGSSSTRGGTPPLLAPYFAAKAAMDALAVSYAGELARFDIETSILVPGAFTKGTQHFAHAGRPADEAVAAAYASGAYQGFAEAILAGLAGTVPDDADAGEVAEAMRRIVDAPRGKRPFRVHVDPAQDDRFRGTARAGGVNRPRGRRRLRGRRRPRTRSIQEHVSCGVGAAAFLPFAGAGLGRREAAVGVQALHEAHRAQQPAAAALGGLQQQLRDVARLGGELLEHLAGDQAAVEGFPAGAGEMLDHQMAGGVEQIGLRRLEHPAQLVGTGIALAGVDLHAGGRQRGDRGGVGDLQRGRRGLGRHGLRGEQAERAEHGQGGGSGERESAGHGLFLRIDGLW